MAKHLHSIIHTIGAVDMKSFLFMFVVYSTPTLGVLGTNTYIHMYGNRIFVPKNYLSNDLYNTNCDYLSRPYTYAEL